MEYTAAVITISDKGARGERADTSGPSLARMLEEARAALLGTGVQALACEMTEETGGVAAAFQLRTPFGEGEISLFFPKEGSGGDGGNHLGADAGGL